jgi:hypothetical protein
MKKFIFVGLTAFFFVGSVYGQDRIITAQRDTIWCKILSITSTNIHYEQTGKDKRTTGRFIPVEQVLEYSEQVTKVHREKQPLAHRWWTSVQFGGSYLLASTSDKESQLQYWGISNADAKDFYKRLRRGIHIGGDVYYFINQYVGFGAKYLYFYSSAKLNCAGNMGDGINYLITDMDDRIYVNYAGPSVIAQQWIGRNNRFRLTETAAVGFVHLREEIRSTQYPVSNNQLTTGGTVGIKMEASFEYYPLSWLSVSANAGLFYSRFSSETTSDRNGSYTFTLDEDNEINVSRLDYSVGIRFHF